MRDPAHGGARRGTGASERNLALRQKLTAAHAVQTDLLKQKKKLEDRERELELDVQKGITAGRADVRSSATTSMQR